MKISVIVWDGNFRENLHTIRFFGEQRMAHEEYEFLWVDYYGSNDAVRSAMERYPNFRVVTLDRDPSETWHLGHCINEGARQSRGTLLVIPDGDIAVGPDFLEYVAAECGQSDHVTYFRRYDELERDACEASTRDLAHLEQRCKLLNPLNYAGCLVLHRETFEKVNGYEEHPLFSGPGMNAMETYVRLRNAGCSVRWSDRKIYHPWHPNTGASSEDERQRALLRRAKADYPWIQPYAGLRQSWLTHIREYRLVTAADSDAAEAVLKETPLIDLVQYNPFETE